jgi:hypothetical protein
MRLFSAKTLGLLALTLVGIPCSSYADSIIVPTGLAPGSEYRLAFVTMTEYSATSSNIADYNNDVNTEADSVAALDALGTTWLDIGSTSSVNAIDNIGQDPGVPIYNLDGQLVADDATTSPGGLFSGDLLGKIDFNELGVTQNAGVWTGSNSSGTADDPLGGTDGRLGLSFTVTSLWISTLKLSVSTTDLHLYAISEVLTVPDITTPEPSTYVMGCLGAVVLLLANFARKRSGSGAGTERVE